MQHRQPRLHCRRSCPHVETGRLIITPENTDRMTQNAQFFRQHTRAVAQALGVVGVSVQPAEAWRQRGCLVVDMTFHDCTKHKTQACDTPPCSPDWQRRLRRCADEHRTFRSYYAPSLCLIMGRNYLLTRNINISKGVGNGMSVVVVDVTLRHDAEVTWDAALQCHRVPAHHVRFVTFKYADNLLYSYAKPSSIVVTCLYGAVMARALPPLTGLAGVAIVVTSIGLYNSKPADKTD